MDKLENSLKQNLIFCLQGKALDVAIDLRKNSKTYGKVFQKILSSKNLIGLFNPKRFHPWCGYF